MFSYCPVQRCISRPTCGFLCCMQFDHPEAGVLLDALVAGLGQPSNRYCAYGHVFILTGWHATATQAYGLNSVNVS